MTGDAPIIYRAGETGFLIEFGGTYDPAVNRAVMAFDQAVTQAGWRDLSETMPSFRSVYLRFHLAGFAAEKVEPRIRALLDHQDWGAPVAERTGRLWRLPVVYGGAFGPELAAVAEMMGLTEAQAIEAHSGAELSVAMIGFSPGLAYLGQLPEAWDIPRKTEVTPRVPSGAILVAVRQTVLPATEIPTGWRQIGQTPFKSLMPERDQPFLLAPGDRVRFEPIAAEAFAVFDQAAFLAGAEAAG